MKKTLSLILAVMMLLGCMSITAFAAENEATITAEITAADFGYTMVIPTTTTLTEANHENVLLGTDGKVSIKDIKHPNDKINVSYTVDLTNGNLTDGTNTINATYKYKQGANEFAAIDGTTKVTVYANKTVTDSFVNVTANKDQWNAAPAGTYNASVTFNFKKEDVVTVADLLNTVEGGLPSSNNVMTKPDGAWQSEKASCWNCAGFLTFVGHSDYNQNSGISPSSTVELVEEGKYKYTDTRDNFTTYFFMEDGVLTKINFAGGWDPEVTAGDYTPPVE